MFEAFLLARDSSLNSVVAATMDIDRGGPIAWPAGDTEWSHGESLLGGDDYQAADTAWYLARRLIAHVDSPGERSLADAIMELVDLQPNICRRRLAGLFDQTLLHCAATVGDDDLARRLIAAGADADALDSKGRSAFDLADDGSAVKDVLVSDARNANDLPPSGIAFRPATPCSDIPVGSDSVGSNTESVDSGQSSVFSYTDSLLADLAVRCEARSEAELLELSRSDLDELVSQTAKEDASFHVDEAKRTRILKEWQDGQGRQEPELVPEPEPQPEPEPMSIVEPVLEAQASRFVTVDVAPEGLQPELRAPTASLSPSGPLGKPALEWSVAELKGWLSDALELPDVADAIEREGIDGARAMEMDPKRWQRLGAKGLHSAKIAGQLKKLARGTG